MKKLLAVLTAFAIFGGGWFWQTSNGDFDLVAVYNIGGEPHGILVAIDVGPDPHTIQRPPIG